VAEQVHWGGTKHVGGGGVTGQGKELGNILFIAGRANRSEWDKGRKEQAIIVVNT